MFIHLMVPAILLISMIAQSEDNPDVREFLQAEERLKKEEDSLQKELRETQDAQAKALQKGLELARKDHDIVATAAELLPYARMAAAAYSYRLEEIEGFERLDKTDYPDGFQAYFVVKNKSLHLPEFGMAVIGFRSTGTGSLVLAFKGTELRVLDKRNLPDFSKNANTVLQTELGYDNEHFQRAYELARQLRAKFPAATMMITGSSLAGAITQYVALRNNLKGIAFNSLGLNSAQIAELKQESPDALANAVDLVTIASLAGDTVSNFISIPRITNSYLGRVVEIPHYSDDWKTYYFTIHHTMDAVVKSLVAIVEDKREGHSLTCSGLNSDYLCSREAGCVWDQPGSYCLNRTKSFCRSAGAQASCQGIESCIWDAGANSCLSGNWSFCSSAKTPQTCETLGCVWDEKANTCLQTNRWTRTSCEHIMGRNACQNDKLPCLWDDSVGCFEKTVALCDAASKGGESTCKQAGCEWINNDCYVTNPSCEDISIATKCNGFSRKGMRCVWINDQGKDTCVDAYDTPCKKLRTKDACEKSPRCQFYLPGAGNPGILIWGIGCIDR